VISISNLETIVNVNDSVLTINSSSNKSLSGVQILKDSTIDTSPYLAGRISVTYDEEKSEGDKNTSTDDRLIYKVSFDFDKLYDYTDIASIELNDIKIKGNSANDVKVSFDGSNYSLLSSVKGTIIESSNTDIGLSTSNLGDLDIEGFSTVIYVDVTNSKNFLGSRITFELDIVDGIGNRWSIGNDEMELDAFFPKQDLILRGRQKDSNREKTSKIQVVGDGSGASFDIQSVIEGGKED
jgi:hypothetical protein